MARRRRSRSPVSFFAFQDIITAVSGIVIVMVLLLTLELVRRPKASASPTIVVESDLREAAAEAQRELDRLEAQLTERDETVRELANSTSREIERDIRDLRQTIERLDEQIDRLEEQRKRLRAQKEAVEVEWFEQRDDRKTLATLRERIGELEERLEREPTEERTVFRLPRGLRENGWIVVVAADRISTAPAARRQKPLVFRGGEEGLFPKSPAEEFEDWALRKDSSSAYFLLLVRPDGLEMFSTITESLEESGNRYGFDLIGKGETVLHPQRGAVR